MSTSKAIKPKRDETTLLSNFESMPERAPSIEREDRPVFARIVAMGGLFFLVLGTLAYLAPRWQTLTIIPPGLGLGFAILGLCPILFHCFVERDVQFRRLYGFLGVAFVLGGVVFRIMAFRSGFMPLFLIYGIPALFLGLVLLLAVIRNETDLQFRTLLLNFVGAIGAITLAFCAVYSLRDVREAADFLAGQGVVLLVLGLLYVSTYLGQQEIDSERGYYTALGIGGYGALLFALGLIRSIMPDSNFFVPGGVILMGMGMIYGAISIGICCDAPIIVLARRDLAAYFYSPVAYLVIIGIVLLGWYMFLSFVDQILSEGARGQLLEPIVKNYVFELFAVIVQIFLVPVITMRLLSEEQRTGTLEVMMTAPVNEISVVVGKFLACWIFYMLTWVPWWLFLVSLRYFGGEEFDYRPILSFNFALAATSAGLIAMGLFFSSMTSNQIIAAVLTFVGVLAHLCFYIIKFRREFIREGSAVHEFLSFVNFYDLWQDALTGIVAPRYLMFHVSVALFFLFATIKVLESRKWK